MSTSIAATASSSTTLALPNNSPRLLARPLQIQRQQAFEDFFIGHGGGVVAPAVGGGDRCVELLVGGLQPLDLGKGALVVEVGERALGEAFEVLLAQVIARQDAVGIRAGFHAQRYDFGQALRPLGRVEPAFPQRVQALGGAGY